MLFQLLLFLLLRVAASQGQLLDTPKISTSKYRSVVNQEQTLICTAASNENIEDTATHFPLQWSKDGQAEKAFNEEKQARGQSFTYTSSLQFTVKPEKHRNVYTCTATFSSGTKSATHTLYVLQGPGTPVVQGPTTVVSGQPVTWECFADGASDTAPNVYWQFGNGTRLHRSHFGNTERVRMDSNGLEIHAVNSKLSITVSEGAPSFQLVCKVVHFETNAISSKTIDVTVSLESGAGTTTDSPLSGSTGSTSAAPDNSTMNTVSTMNTGAGSAVYMTWPCSLQQDAVNIFICTINLTALAAAKDDQITADWVEFYFSPEKLNATTGYQLCRSPLARTSPETSCNNESSVSGDNQCSCVAHHPGTLTYQFRFFLQEKHKGGNLTCKICQPAEVHHTESKVNHTESKVHQLESALTNLQTGAACSEDSCPSGAQCIPSSGEKRCDAVRPTGYACSETSTDEDDDWSTFHIIGVVLATVILVAVVLLGFALFRRRTAHGASVLAGTTTGNECTSTAGQPPTNAGTSERKSKDSTLQEDPNSASDPYSSSNLTSSGGDPEDSSVDSLRLEESVSRTGTAQLVSAFGQ
jgi:hypothetical protein